MLDLETCRTRTQYNAVQESKPQCRPLLSKRKKYHHLHFTDADIEQVSLDYMLGLMHDFLHYWHFIDRKTTPAVWDFEKNKKNKKRLLYCCCTAPNYAHLISLQESCLWCKIQRDMLWNVQIGMLKSPSGVTAITKNIFHIFKNVHFKSFFAYIV